MIGKNNPMNIRDYEASRWFGEIGSTRGFVDFDSRANCFRAFWKILAHYKSLGINTIDGVIRRYSPPLENETEALVNRAVRMVGVERTTFLKPDNWFMLGCAIFFQENGFYVDSDIADVSDYSEFKHAFVIYFYNQFYDK